MKVSISLVSILVILTASQALAEPDSAISPLRRCKVSENLYDTLSKPGSNILVANQEYLIQLRATAPGSNNLSAKVQLQTVPSLTLQASRRVLGGGTDASYSASLVHSDSNGKKIATYEASGGASGVWLDYQAPEGNLFAMINIGCED